MTFYRLTENGIQQFEDNILNEVWNLMEDEKHENIPDIKIYVGKNHISIPMHADSFQALIQFLEKAKC